MKVIQVAATLFILASCTHRDVDSDVSVFQNRESYVGDVVEVCGFVDRGFFMENLTLGSNGLLILNSNDIQIEEGSEVCVRGEIAKVKCGTKGLLCVDRLYGFGISIEELLSD